MKILQATETYGPGGAEQVLISLSKALQAAGHDVSVLMLRPGWLADELRAAGIPVHTLTLARPLDPGFLSDLTEFLRTHSPDVLHSHEFTFAFYGRLAALRAGTPMVATAHGANVVTGFKRRLLGTACLRPTRRFRLAAVSEALARQVAGQLWVPARRLDVVRNGIALAGGCASAAGSMERFRLVAVGNLYPVKNHAELVRIVARLRARGVPAEVDVLGRGSEEAQVRQEIARFGLEDCVRLQGFRSDVDRFLAAAQVFVSTSISEQMPVSFLEAMARDLPVVASSVGGVPEIIEDGRDGLLYASGDEAAAAAHLEALWRDPALRTQLGRSARRKVETSYATSVMVQTYLDLYAAAGSSSVQVEPRALWRDGQPQRKSV